MQKVITHSGLFHADDVMAVAILIVLYGELDLERRDPTKEELDDPSIIVLDVGGRFDPATNCFDHHQFGFDLQREGCGVEGEKNPLAAAGLIWNHYEIQMIPARMELADVANWHVRVDMQLIRGIDALDCGVGERSVVGESPSLSQCVSWLNPCSDSPSDEERDFAFQGAVPMCQSILEGVGGEASGYYTSQSNVLHSKVESRILTLDEFTPWQEHILTHLDYEDILYVVYPSERGGFMCQQVATEAGGFVGRKPLPECWAGLREEELQKVCGVPDATFCHLNRFVGGAASLAGALDMAKRAVAWAG